MNKNLQGGQLGKNANTTQKKKTVKKKPALTPSKEMKVDLKKDFVKAYLAKDCNISLACLAVGITRPTFYNWLEDDKSFANDIEVANDEDLDFTEGQLKRLIKGQYTFRLKKDKAGNPVIGNDGKPEFEYDAEGEIIRDYITPIDNGAVFFKLKTKGQKRGYIYKTQTELVNGASGGFQINIAPPSDKKKD